MSVEASQGAAGLGRLYASLLYDALLLVALLLVETTLFLPLWSAVDPALQRPLLQLWLLLLTFGYFLYCWRKSGQTLPMRTWRIRLVAADGGHVTTRHALLRYLFALFSVSIAGLGWLWAIFDKEHRYLHDTLAGTRIVTCEPEKT